MRNKRKIQIKPNSTLKRILALFLFCLILFGNLHARLRFIGPNPYYSFLTFPQDTRLFKTNASLFFLYYRSRGWMGHLDVPESSPSPQYVATRESVQENFSDTIVANVGFRGNWVTPEILTVPFILDFKSIRFIPMISGQLDIFDLKSSGEAISYGEAGDTLIPFSSKLSQRNSEYSFGFLASTSIKNIPIGMMFNYRQKSEDSPRGYLEYTVNGIETRLNRFNWGWSTAAGCNHIFGDPTNIDAFWQDRYAHSESSQLDFVIGTDIKENKMGFRFRKITEYGDYYSYSDSLNKYVKDGGRDRTTKTLLRAFDVFKILNIGEAKLFLCGVIETDFIRKRDVREDVALFDFFKEDAYVFELLPFIHFDILERGFIRIGSSASFFYKNYTYQDVWGDQIVHSPSSPVLGWERSWERSSHGNTFTFINFSEVNIDIPVFQKWNLLLSMDLWSHQVISRTKRYYGRNVSDGDVYKFNKTAERKNTLRESWFGGTFGMFVGHKLSFGIFMDLPVYYDASRTTEVRGGDNFFSGLSNPQPAVRTPVGFWAMLVMRW